MGSLVLLFFAGMIVLVPLLILAVFVLIVYSNVSSKAKAKRKCAATESNLDELQKRIVVVTGSSVPGSQIKRAIGVVRGVSDTQASSKEQFSLAEKEALYNMLVEAEKLGANAVIELKLNTGTYQQQGSRWQVSQCIYNGTAVEIG
jgi:uncharacterized protein YbjQ (UPF0145 family)